MKLLARSCSARITGIQQKDLDITLTANQLRIAGRREATKHEENEHSYLAEREYGAFERVFTLPEGVDGEKVQATMNDGVLSLVVCLIFAGMLRNIARAGVSAANANSSGAT